MVSSLLKLLKIFFLIVVTVTCCLGIVLAVFLFVLDDYQKSRLFTSAISKYSQVDIKRGKLLVSYRDGSLLVRGDQLHLTSRAKPVSLQIDHAEIHVPLSNVFTPDPTISSIILNGPAVDLSDYPIRESLTSGKKKQKFSTRLFNYCNILVKNGTVMLPDNVQVSEISFKTTLETKKIRHILLQGRGYWKERDIPFSIKGSINSFVRPYGLNLELAANALPVDNIQVSSRFHINRGTMSIRSRISSIAKTDTFHIHSNINLLDVLFSINKSGKEKTYRFNHLHTQIEAKYTNGLFTLLPSTAGNDLVNLRLSGRFDLRPVSPYLDLEISSDLMNVKTLKRLIPDPYLSLWLTSELFPIFSKGQGKVDKLAIKGSWEQLKNMGQSENRSCFELDLSLVNLDIVLSKPKAIFTGSSARLTIVDGKLRVFDIKGATKKTTVRQGWYQIDDLYGEELISRFAINGTATLQDLAHISAAPLLPEKLRKDGQLFASYSGQLKADIMAHYAPSYDTLRFDRFDVTITDVTSKKEIRGSPVSFDNITITRKTRLRNQVVGIGTWRGTDFSLSGFFLDDATGTMTIKAKVDMETLLPFIRQDQFPPDSFNFEQLFGLTIQVQKQIDTFIVDVKTELPKLDAISCSTTKSPLTNGFLSTRLTTQDWHVLKMNSFTVSYGQYILQGKGSIDLKTMKMAMALHSPEQVTYYDAQGEPEKEKRKGPLQADLSVDIDMNEPEKSSLHGRIQGQDLSIKLPGLVSPAVNTIFDLQFSGKRIDFNRFDFWLEQNLLGSPVHLQGHLQMDDQLGGVLLFTGDYVNSSDIFNESTKEDEQQQENESSPNSGQGIVVNAKIRKLDFSGTIISPFYFQGFATNGNFFPVKMSARLENGRIGMLTHLGEDDTENLEFSFFIKNLDIEDFSKFVPHLDKGEVKGKITTGGIIRSQSNSFKNLGSKLKGELSFRVHDATLKGNYILVRLLELLSIENLFSKKADYAEDGDLYIKSINGNLTIDNSVLTSNDILINTFAFDATGDLKIDLHNNTVTSHLAVSPFGAVDTIVSTIPIIGHILTGEEKSVVSYHFQVSGSPDDLKITYVPLKDLPKSLFGYGIRLLSPSTYLFFLPQSKKGRNYDRVSEELVAEVEQDFQSDQELLKGPEG